MTFSLGLLVAKKHMRAIALLSIVLPLWAVTMMPDVEPQLDRMATIDRFVLDGPLFLKRTSGEDVRDLGEVASESTETVPNPHAEGSIRYTKLRFKDGLEIYFRSFGVPVQVQFIEVTVTSPKWPIKHGLNVGVPVDDVLRVLGEPTKKSAEEIAFTGETDQVIFHIKDAHVIQVQFLYYAD